MRDQRALERRVEAMQHPTEEEEQRVLAAYGMTRTAMARDVAAIRAWLQKQPHLPADDVDDVVIERMLVRSRNSVVKVQQRLDDIYSVRGELPEFYADRDPLGARIQQSLRVVGIAIMPKMTPDLNRVYIMRLRERAVERFSVEVLLKTVTMVQDIVVREPPTMGDIIIFDASGYQLAHAAGVSPLFVRKVITHVKRTYPARVAGIHVVYPPPFAGRIINVIKSFLSDKLASRIHAHDTLESLLEHVPQDVLPADYGGKGRPCDELSDVLEKKLVSYREYFLDTEKIRSNEALRQEKRKDDTFSSSLDGSFRKLDLD